MKLILHPTNAEYVLFLAETVKEVKVLEAFPGLLRLNTLTWFSQKNGPILYNVCYRLKKLVDLEIMESLRSLINGPFRLSTLQNDFKFFTEPLLFQELALRFLIMMGGGGLLLDPGMGKTKIVLDFIAHQGFSKALIVSPKPLLEVWRDEAEQHRPDLGIYIIKTTDWDKEEQGILGSRVVVTNYSKAVLLCKNAAFTDLGWDFIALDEGLIKDPKSQRTKALYKLSQKIKSRVIMSGTLVNNSALDVFAPVRFLFPSLVGESFTNFANVYAYKKKIKLASGQSVMVHIKKDRDKDAVRGILRTSSIIMTKKEWLNLPEKVFHKHIVQLSDETREAYFKFARNWILELPEGTIESDNALGTLCKLTQISNGFVYLDENTDEPLEDLGFFTSPKPKSLYKKRNRPRHLFNDTAKPDRLLRILREDAAGHRVMIWYNLDAEKDIITGALEKAGITYILAQGGDKKLNSNIREYNRTPSIRCLVCQAKTINYGVTVLGNEYDEDDPDIPIGVTPEVFTQIFYSLNFSLEVFIQQQDRIHRIGQKFTCHYHFILGNTPTEMKIFLALEDKQYLREYMLEEMAAELRNSEELASMV